MSADMSAAYRPKKNVDATVRRESLGDERILPAADIPVQFHEETMEP